MGNSETIGRNILQDIGICKYFLKKKRLQWLKEYNQELTTDMKLKQRKYLIELRNSLQSGRKIFPVL